MLLSQFFSWVHYSLGPQMDLLSSSQSTHLARSYWGCCCLFPHFKGVGWRCGYIASFSCSPCLKENFAFESLKMMGVPFAPVDMGLWAPNSFSTRKMLSLVFYDWLKWDSMCVLNGSVLVIINKSETPCIFVSLFVVGELWWCVVVTCRLESVRIFSSDSWMMSILSHLELGIFSLLCSNWLLLPYFSTQGYRYVPHVQMCKFWLLITHFLKKLSLNGE